MIRTVIMPSAVDGIVTGCILAVGRIAGESAALLFTAGMTDEILSLADAFSKGQSGSTLTVALYIYAKERGDTGTAFAIAVILLIFTLIINISAKYAAAYLKRGK
jgi:phosphate transport system permease protein